MHPFPEASKLQFLVDTELKQICFAQWQIQLDFDSAHIIVEGSLEHIDKSGIVRQHNTDESRLSPFLLHHLIGQKIRLLEVEPFRLTLSFEDGDILCIFSEQGPYECGQICNENGQGVIF